TAPTSPASSPRRAACARSTAAAASSPGSRRSSARSQESFTRLTPRRRAPAARAFFLAELARLERAVEEVFHAPQAAPVALERLQSIPPDHWTDAVFVTIPALRLFEFGFPVNGYLQAVIDQTAPSIPARMPTWIA